MYACKVGNVYIKFMYVMYRYRIYVKDELYALLVYVCMYIIYVMYRYRIYEKDELYAYMHILNIYM